MIEALNAVRRASALDEDRERLLELALTILSALSTLNDDTEYEFEVA